MGIPKQEQVCNPIGLAMQHATAQAHYTETLQTGTTAKHARHYLNVEMKTQKGLLKK
jgi:hypothetical protein